MRRQKPTEREHQERGLEFLGFVDRMSARHFLMGEQIESWGRDCKCAGECDCWEFTGRRPATTEEMIMFRKAQIVLPKPAIRHDGEGR